MTITDIIICLKNPDKKTLVVDQNLHKETVQTW